MSAEEIRERRRQKLLARESKSTLFDQTADLESPRKQSNNPLEATVASDKPKSTPAKTNDSLFEKTMEKEERKDQR